jgi:glycosyltransferase involved in cell wall biosynthesis
MNILRRVIKFLLSRLNKNLIKLIYFILSDIKFFFTKIVNIISRPKISVVIFTFNSASTISECLNSVLSQKTKFKFEVIIMDDSSTDKTLDICRNILNNSVLKSKIIRNKFNTYKYNYLSTIKKAFTKSAGQFIAIIDGDDFWTSNNKLEQQFKLLENNPTFVLCFTQYAYGLDPLHTDIYPYEKVLDQLILTGESYSKLNNLIGKSTVMVNKELFVFPQKDLPHDIALDWLLWAFQLEKLKAIFLPQVTTFYRIHEGGSHSGLGVRGKKMMELRTLTEIVDLCPKFRTNWDLKKTAWENDIKAL